MKLKYPRCCFAEAPALIPLECSSNIDADVELTNGTRLVMYGKALGCNLESYKNHLNCDFLISLFTYEIERSTALFFFEKENFHHDVDVTKDSDKNEKQQVAI